MESKLIKKPWGWEYISKSGLGYAIGEVTTEFNIVVDFFGDIDEIFDCNTLIESKLVDYVYGDLEEDSDCIKNWLDRRIETYEKHERTVRFYTNIIGRSDIDGLYECYIGTEEKINVEVMEITKERMYEIAKEIVGGK